MSILSFIKGFWGNSKINISENKYYKLRTSPFFLNQLNQEQYLTHGWTLVKDVIRPIEIDSFMHTFNEISKLEGFELDKNLLNSGRLFNPEIRKKTQDVINRNAATILPRMFNMDIVDSHTGGAYQVKPPHVNSDLLIHQDSTVIDEEND
jgi:hypothetical protein